nr:Tn3 family transposase [Priestia flexa]
MDFFSALELFRGHLFLSPLIACRVVILHVILNPTSIRNHWSNINLLDLLKETDFLTGFTKHFKTTADRSILDQETIQRRLLLCLFGLGTNTGLKAVSAGNNPDSYR